MVVLYSRRKRGERETSIIEAPGDINIFVVVLYSRRKRGERETSIIEAPGDIIYLWLFYTLGGSEESERRPLSRRQVILYICGCFIL